MFSELLVSSFADTLENRCFHTQCIEDVVLEQAKEVYERSDLLVLQM